MTISPRVVLFAVAAVLLAVCTVLVATGDTGPARRDPRCALINVTNAQCAARYADNGVNGDR
jgi:hypothetical protein